MTACLVLPWNRPHYTLPVTHRLKERDLKGLKLLLTPCPVPYRQSTPIYTIGHNGLWTRSSSLLTIWEI